MLGTRLVKMVEYHNLEVGNQILLRPAILPDILPFEVCAQSKQVLAQKWNNTFYTSWTGSN